MFYEDNQMNIYHAWLLEMSLASRTIFLKDCLQLQIEA
jgi:hypothetical protein